MTSVHPRSAWSYPALVLPAASLLTVLFLYPLLLLLLGSVGLAQTTSGLGAGSWRLYGRVLGDPFYLRVIGRSLGLGILCVITTLGLGFPVAWAVVRTRSRWKRKVLSLALVMPFFTNLVLLAYGWMVLLANRGFVNQSLHDLRLVDAPLPLMFSFTGILIGMTHLMLPYMALSLTSILKTLDRRQEEAARTLGAGEIQVFRYVVLPHCRRGIATGAIVVFLLTLGAFVMPRLLGSPKNHVLATLIAEQVLFTGNWAFGGALGFVLLAIAVPFIVLLHRVSRGAGHGA
jgi:putative spermidine/putrescine transport system permease protein